MRTSRPVQARARGNSGTMVSTVTENKPAGGREMKSYGPRRVSDGVIFTASYPQAGSVQLAGDFNNWQPAGTPMVRAADGSWQVKLNLAKGVYRYRLVVDGQWQQDPNNTMTEPNPYGELDSVVTVN